MVYKKASNPCGHGNLDHADNFLKSTIKSLDKKDEYHLCSLICINGFFVNNVVTNFHNSLKKGNYSKFFVFI